MVGGLDGLVLAVDTAWVVTVALMFFSAVLSVTLLAVVVVRGRRNDADIARRSAVTASELAALRAELADRQTS